MITQDKLKSVLIYNEESGKFSWVSNRGRRYCKGKEAGCVSLGYII